MGEHLHTPSFIAYYGLLQLQAQTFERLARDLETETGLPASWYEVMACLQAHEDGQRMNELADELLISRGGATKLIARLEAAGYVERLTPKTDRRATYAKLTPAGEQAITAAHPVQLRLVEEHFGQFLSADDLASLTRIASKVLKGIDAQCSWLDTLTGEDGVVLEPAAVAK
ncbi:MAG: MarR family winged helix-turn-helix transcriptional regulator [Solirubrobacteraceae bacterium]|nr:MarR family winged helix-turn-helix transcriptional regulator [Solirubrobacteraceae bacterium]